MGIIGKIKKELLERIIGKFKSIMYSSLVIRLRSRWSWYFIPSLVGFLPYIEFRILRFPGKANFNDKILNSKYTLIDNHQSSTFMYRILGMSYRDRLHGIDRISQLSINKHNHSYRALTSNHTVKTINYKHVQYMHAPYYREIHPNTHF